MALLFKWLAVAMVTLATARAGGVIPRAGGGGNHNGALIKSKSGQPLTSSALTWVVVVGLDSAMPEDAVQSGSPGGGYVCRFQHAGRMQIGGTHDESGCRIVYYGRVVSRQERFEVLVNVHGAGRIVWTPWDRTAATTFTGAVQVGDHHVARVLVQLDKDEEGYQLGHLDPNVHRGRIYSAGGEKEQVLEYTQGEVLVEVEPVKYEVGPLQWSHQRRKIQSREEVQLAHTVLDREVDDYNLTDGQNEQEDDVVASTLTYVNSHSVYIGQVRGMVKGLPSSIHLGASGVLAGQPDGGDWVPFRWGEPSSTTASASFPQLLDVSHRLDRGTAVNVSLAAFRVTFDGPHVAALTTTYADGSVSKRQIDTLARQTLVEDLRLTYSPAYYLSDGSFVPEKTTVTTSTSTTPIPTTFGVTSTTASASTAVKPASSLTKETLELKSRTDKSSRANSSPSSTTSISTMTQSFCMSLLVLSVYVINLR